MKSFALLALITVFALLGCGGEQEVGKSVEQTKEQHISVWTTEQVHQTIRDKNPNYNGNALFKIEKGKVTALDLTKTSVTDFSFLSSMSQLTILDLRGLLIRDLTPLKGISLKTLGLENTIVSDLTPLKGVGIETLYLNNTKVKDIAPLAGMPLVLLNLYGTAVEDLTPLKDMEQLQLLWLNETPVSDISALSNCPLISLTLHKTKVKDLSPLANISTLERLHVAETPVTDLGPIKDLKLTRLIYTPKNITGGSKAVKQMGSLQELGTTFENRMSPEKFWSFL